MAHILLFLFEFGISLPEKPRKYKNYDEKIFPKIHFCEANSSCVEKSATGVEK